MTTTPNLEPLGRDPQTAPCEGLIWGLFLGVGDAFFALLKIATRNPQNAATPRFISRPHERPFRDPHPTYRRWPVHGEGFSLED